MSNRVLPCVAPTITPRSTISIASVTMNAFSFSLTTQNPLNAPTSAPTTKIATKQSHSGQPNPNPPEAEGSSSNAPIAGAMPTVDSSERSNLPLISTSDSPSTTSASAADEPSTLIRLPGVRNASLVTAPMTTSTTSAGSSASSRRADDPSALRTPNSAEPFLGGATVDTPASFAIELDSFDGSDQLSVRPASGMLRRQRAEAQHKDPVAGAQVVQLVADDDDRPTAVT